MAGYYNTSKHQELNDDAHRLLPREILDDIGIVVDPAEQQLLDVIEDLAARLAVALGGTPEKITSPANASRGVRGGLAERGEILAAPPPFSSAAHVVPCHAAIAMAEGFRNNNMVFFGASAQPATVHRRGTGTGVFLPRNEGVCRTASWAACPLGNSNKSIRFSNRRGQQLSSISQQPW